MFRKLTLIATLLLCFALSGCAGSATPQRIASYPANAPSNQSKNQPSLTVHAYYQIEVASPNQAASQASRLAYDFGGYASAAQEWSDNNRQYTLVYLTIPASALPAFRSRLLEYGRLVDERTSVTTSDGSSSPDYTHLSVQFQTPATFSEPVYVPRWDPWVTLQRALSVSVTIFTFIADLLIWIFVILGPIALLIWAARAVLKKVSKA